MSSEGKNLRASPIRVCIVDDHSILREGVRMLIEDQPSMEVVGEAGTIDEAVALISREQPDIILLDLDMGGKSGLDLLRDLNIDHEKTRVLVLTGMRESSVHQEAVMLGALGVVLKEEASTVLIKAITRVHAGEAWLQQSMVANVLTELTRSTKTPKYNAEEAKIATLTAREREIIALIAEGFGTKQMADRLFISEKTVRNHLVSVFSKLGISDRLTLAVYASRHGLTKFRLETR